ncbi:complement resistance protein TraT [Lichenicola cladoniae]|uniref:complement resistance protein TraT n=1 Tax=Lichenicola cladoniae TaxID=1484109 RepID=UPI001EF3F465|nr:complement resistance protein TraT [Lichenicola cladoniae]
MSASSGCAGTDALVNQADLTVHTHMSETVSLDPVGVNHKAIYMGFRNTSDYPDIDICVALAAGLANRIYRIVSDLNEADYMLQGNVLQAGKLEKNQEAALLGGGLGQQLLRGALAGGLAGGLTNGTGTGLALTVDLQLSERPLHGARVYKHAFFHGHANHQSQVAVTDATAQTYGEADSQSMSSSGRTKDVDKTTNFKKYNIRDVAYADNVNLKMEEAMPMLSQHQASSFANLFE